MLYLLQLCNNCSYVKMYQIIILEEGYSVNTEDGTKANCTCSLILGPKKIIVDTMTAWDRDLILKDLTKYEIKPDDIDYVVCTHGHSDHIGNNNLFLNAVHIVGFCISHKTNYINNQLSKGEVYDIDESISIHPTPGHTMSDVSVVITNLPNYGTVGITGDLFENENDLFDDKIWIDAGSENKTLQQKNRHHILSICDWIVPGHGKMFKVPDKCKLK